jgi:hypothetical protein
MIIDDHEWFYNPTLEEFECLSDGWLLSVRPEAAEGFAIDWYPTLKQNGKIVVSKESYPEFDDAAKRCVLMLQELEPNS